MNKFMNALKQENNKTLTENGAITYKSTLNGLLDLFAMGGAYRSRSEDDCIHLFNKAYGEDEAYALKCLFYLRDVRGGQGERRFFRTVTHWLANSHTASMKRNLQYVPEFGRWDDLYSFVGTPLEKEAFKLMKHQLALDVDCKTPSLLAKWLKSENTSSADSRLLADKTRRYLNMTHKQYRKTLSTLRERIRVVERLMSAGRWDEIEFDKIPSRAGLIYKNAFARRDIIKEKYKSFAMNQNTTVNAKALYPYEVVHQAMQFNGSSWFYHTNQGPDSEVNRAMINKYWDNLEDFFNGCTFNGMAVVDTSGSMYGTPMEVAISLGMYCAERNHGPFANHFYTFSNNPTFTEIEGYDFVDKVTRMAQADWGGSTNVEAVFDDMLDIAKRTRCSQEDIPETLIIISDMEFNACAVGGPRQRDRWMMGRSNHCADETLFETIERRWNDAGYKMPNLVFWNVDARHDNIPMRVEGHVSFVSGFSPVLFEQVLKGKTAYDLMYDKLDSERYACIK